ncbi:hypothetical protein D9757_006572 [Collybiopsis confluens]|uniref:Uncharacterized protein n=1 Tax=Collybiopsis confluens TaxID=2823264 RepID=A0A8H5MBH5_9AGAR|nr:hypothetical protein D9757_006572 [Collybiopsis confluens]
MSSHSVQTDSDSATTAPQQPRDSATRLLDMIVLQFGTIEPSRSTGTAPGAVTYRRLVGLSQSQSVAGRAVQHPRRLAPQGQTGVGGQQLRPSTNATVQSQARAAGDPPPYTARVLHRAVGPAQNVNIGAVQAQGGGGFPNVPPLRLMRYPYPSVNDTPQAQAGGGGVYLAPNAPWQENAGAPGAIPYPYPYPYPFMDGALPPPPPPPPQGRVGEVGFPSNNTGLVQYSRLLPNTIPRGGPAAQGLIPYNLAAINGHGGAAELMQPMGPSANHVPMMQLPPRAPNGAPQGYQLPAGWDEAWIVRVQPAGNGLWQGPAGAAGLMPHYPPPPAYTGYHQPRPVLNEPMLLPPNLARTQQPQEVAANTGPSSESEEGTSASDGASNGNEAASSSSGSRSQPSRNNLVIRTETRSNHRSNPYPLPSGRPRRPQVEPDSNPFQMRLRSQARLEEEKNSVDAAGAKSPKT